MSSFQDKRNLKYVINIGTDSFDEKGDNVLTLSGLRSSLYIDKAGGYQMGTLRAKIYGVNIKSMNAATTLQWKPKLRIKNTIQVFANDAPIFGGNIVNAWADLRSIPQGFLFIFAQSCFFPLITPVQPRSYKGTVAAETIFAQLAASMKLAFENSGVHVNLDNVYLDNTDLEQVRTLARMIDCNLYIDDTILAITPKHAARSLEVPLVSADTGLVGYPTFDGVGVAFKTLYNPAIHFGGQVQLQSELPQANGTWRVTGVSHFLESEKPGGEWFSHIRGNENGLAIITR